MKMSDWVRKLAAALGSIVLVCSCSTSGKTSHGAVPLDALPEIREMRPLQVQSLDREDEGIRLISLDVRPSGKFNDEDKTNLRRSLEETLQAALRNRACREGSGVQLHVLIRKYVVAANNSQAVVWASVDWCAADEGGQVLYSEAFHATAMVHLFGSLGGIKDQVNRAVVKRIAQNALAVAADANRAEGNIAGTYASFDEAAASIPAMLETWGLPFFVAVAPEGLVASRSAQKSSANLLSTEAKIDWATRLSRTH
jgi:hypothetical protein